MSVEKISLTTIKTRLNNTYLFPQDGDPVSGWEGVTPTLVVTSSDETGVTITHSDGTMGRAGDTLFRLARDTKVLAEIIEKINDGIGGAPKEYVRINVGDGSAGYLADKIEAGVNISFTIVEDSSGARFIRIDSYIELDPTPLDLSASGTIVPMQVDENATGFGAALHMDTDGNWIEADADAVATMPCQALALETGTGVKDILKYGFIRNDAWTWTVGGLIYASCTTGGLTQTAPVGAGDQVQVVGYATHANRMFFNPSYVLLEI